MKVVVYSALYGDYEQPRLLPYLGVPAIMYTDRCDLEAPGWIVKYRPAIALAVDTPMMKAKYWKCHPEMAAQDADITIWLDASVTVEVKDLVERCLVALGEDDWTAVRHPVRDCIYTEADFSLTLPRYADTRIREQVETYRSYGHPAHWGLFANGLIVRRHTPVVELTGRQWYHECTTWSYQDQLSLPVLIRLAGNTLKWNTNIPWGQWWTAGLHSPLG